MISRRSLVLGAVAVAGCHAEPQANDAAAPPATSASGVPRRTLGKTGESVSMIGVGGFHIGQKNLSDDESVALIRRAIDEGINFLDNCWDYNDGNSEQRMGKALTDGYRERVFLMTKLDGRTASAATAQLEQSLARLGTDRIDLVQIHEVIRDTDPDRCFAPGGVVEALVAAQKAGKLRYIGFTGHKDPKIHLKMLSTADQHGFRFDTVQMPLNVMDAHFNSFEHEVLPVLLSKQIGVLGMKSMGSGDILKSNVVTPAECLRYALSLPTSVVITGIDNQKVLAHHLQLVRSFQPLNSDERTALLAKTKAPANDGKYEMFKTADKFDGTGRNPHWLEEAKL